MKKYKWKRSGTSPGPAARVGVLRARDELVPRGHGLAADNADAHLRACGGCGVGFKKEAAARRKMEDFAGGRRKCAARLVQISYSVCQGPGLQAKQRRTGSMFVWRL